MGSVAEIPFGIDSTRHLVRRELPRHAAPPDRTMLAGAAASLHHAGRELRDESGSNSPLTVLNCTT